MLLFTFFSWELVLTPITQCPRGRHQYICDQDTIWLLPGLSCMNPPWHHFYVWLICSENHSWHQASSSKRKKNEQFQIKYYYGGELQWCQLLLKFPSIYCMMLPKFVLFWNSSKVGNTVQWPLFLRQEDHWVACCSEVRENLSVSTEFC